MSASSSLSAEAAPFSPARPRVVQAAREAQSSSDLRRPLSPRVKGAAARAARRNQRKQAEAQQPTVQPEWSEWLSAGVGSISMEELKRLTRKRLELEKQLEDDVPLPPSPKAAEPSASDPRPAFAAPSLLVPLSPTKVIRDAGTPRGLMKVQAAPPTPLSPSFQLDEEEDRKTTRPDNTDQDEDATEVVVVQKGSKTYTRIVKKKKKKGRPTQTKKKPALGRTTGRVSKLMGPNFGFLHADGSNYDCFMHMSEVALADREAIEKGSKVVFTVIRDQWRAGSGEVKAVDVELLK